MDPDLALTNIKKMLQHAPKRKILKIINYLMPEEPIDNYETKEEFEEIKELILESIFYNEIIIEKILSYLSNEKVNIYNYEEQE